ncbi:MAG TPA: prephenate dehydrogenase/arogenate dehydrogenase family protein [Thermoleophilaceae bacterium]|nr:prephenate dehydrogenase/arogenate dehydrogenase family protein [Thermoleophilaceae bacterium]
MTPLRVGVIGLGLIGGSIAQRLAERPGEFEVAGFDADGSPRDGLELKSSAGELAAASDLVVVAVPPERTAEAVADALAANGNASVTDVASVKAPILDEVRRLAPDALHRYLLGHPLAGAEESGWHAARPELLDLTTWAVCPPTKDAPAGPLEHVGRLVNAFNARLVVCDPRAHDRAVARTSHAPHLVAKALAAAPPDSAPLTALLSGGAFRDMTRVAASDPRLWESILELNQQEVRGVLDEWIAALGGSGPEQEPMLELVESLRWNEPRAWETRALDWPAWNELIELSRSGIAIRLPRLEGDRLIADTAVT